MRKIFNTVLNSALIAVMYSMLFLIIIVLPWKEEKFRWWDDEEG